MSNDVEQNLIDTLRRLTDVGKYNLPYILENIKIVILNLHANRQILQNSANQTCKELFSLIIIRFPSVATFLIEKDGKLLDIIKECGFYIERSDLVNCNNFTDEVAEWLLKNGAIDVSSELFKEWHRNIIHFYMYNDGQINKYIEFIKEYIDYKITSHNSFTVNKINYEIYKEMIITNDQKLFTNFSHTLLPSILLTDIETYANDLIRSGNLDAFKTVFIAVPDDEVIGHLRYTVPDIAKTYFIYKIGIEILTGSSLYDTYISANFKLVLWLFHIIFNQESCLLLELPKEILLEIIKLLSCKIGPDRHKPISRGIYCLNLI